MVACNTSWNTTEVTDYTLRVTDFTDGEMIIKMIYSGTVTRRCIV